MSAQISGSFPVPNASVSLLGGPKCGEREEFKVDDISEVKYPQCLDFDDAGIYRLVLPSEPPWWLDIVALGMDCFNVYYVWDAAYTTEKPTQIGPGS